MCNFGRGHYEEQLLKIILNLGQWFRRCLKYFLSGALVALLFSGVEQFMHILKEGIMGFIHVNLYEIWTSGLGVGDVT